METPVLSRLRKNAGRNLILADGLDEYAGEWTTTEVVHLLKRTLFGVKISDLNYFLGLSMSQAVDEILTPAPPLSTVPLNSYSANGYSDPTGVASWDTWINTGIDYIDAELNGLRADSLKSWLIGNMLNENRSIHEKLTIFWHNHFAINSASTLELVPTRLWYDYYLILRQHALAI